MITCPNKNLKSWKKLVESRGENTAYNLWFLYDGIVPEKEYISKIKYHKDFVPSKEDLNNKLSSFLNKVNFTVKQVKDINELTGFNALSTTDLLHKTILLEENKEHLLLKETAYVAYSLLGKRNKLRTSLITSIDNIDNYSNIFNQYQTTNPNLSEYKIKELIVVDFIADAIKNNYEIPKDSYVNQQSDYWMVEGSTKLKKKLNYYLGLIKKLISEFLGKNKLSKDKLNTLIDDIANDILELKKYKFNDTLLEEDKLTNYEDTIKNDERALEIVNNMKSFDLILTGSLALRKQGTLYRTDKETLHDLDFSLLNSKITKEDKKLVKEIITQWVVTPPGFLMNYKLDKIGFLSKIKQIYPDFKITSAFKGLNDNEFTISGSIGDYVIDIFLVNDEVLDKNEKTFQDWESIFTAKLRMGRLKDMKDFINYIPFKEKTSALFSQDKGFRHFTFKDNSNLILTPQNRIQKTQQSEAIKNISNKVEKIC